MPKISHCSRWFTPSEFITLKSNEQYKDEFSHQVLMIGTCPVCKEERRAWYGIFHDGIEDYHIRSINPKRFDYWDRRKSPTSTDRDNQNKGALAVTVQRRWENKASYGMTLQRVR